MLSYLLILFVCLIPLGMVMPIIEYGLTIMPLLGLFIFSLWIIKLGIEKVPLIIVPEFRWLVGLATVMIIDCVIGGNVSHSFYVFKTYSQLFLLFFLITQVFEEAKQLFLTGWVLIASLSIVAFLLSLDHLQFIELKGGFASIDYEEIHTRALTSGRDPNESALYFSIAIPFVLYYIMIYKDVIKRIFLIACLTVLTSGIILTHSMGGVIGLMSVATFFVLLHKNITIGKKVILSASLVPIFLGMYTLAPATFKSRVQSKYQVVMTEDFTRWGTNRGGIWLAALKVIKQNPLVGVGMGNYPGCMGQQLYETTGIYKEKLVAHNSFLGLAAESGIVALLFFVILIGSILKRLSEKLKRSPLINQNFSHLGSAIYLSLVCFLVQAMFLDLQRNKYFFLLLGLAAVFITIADKPYQPEKK